MLSPNALFFPISSWLAETQIIFLLLCPQAIYSFIMLLLNLSLVSCMLAVTRSYVSLKETYKIDWMVVLQKADNVLYFGSVKLIAR